MIQLSTMLLLLLPLLLFYTYALNLDKNNPKIYHGPKGSYFGFSIDFYKTPDKRMNVIIGAPRLNRSEADDSNTGGVFLCPWRFGSTGCTMIPFDQTGNLTKTKDGIMSIDKSDQWLGATIRAWNTSIVACAPFQRYNFVNPNDASDESGRTPTGACYLTDDLKNFHEFSPCRDTKTERYHFFNDSAQDNRFCEVGFSADISKTGVLLAGAPGGYFFEGLYSTIPLSNIPKASDSIIQKYQGLRKSREMFVNYAYKGFAVAYGEFTEDNIPEIIVSAPNFDNRGMVEIFSGIYKLFSIIGKQIAAHFGHSVAVTDINGDNLDDLLVGAPLFIERKTGGNLLEVGQVYIYKQNSPTVLDEDPQILSGTYVYGQFGASIAPLGDLDQDEYNDVAVGSPFGGQSGAGCVYIYKGGKLGLSTQPSQILEGPSETPYRFGFALRGGEDIDRNGYPDLIVGAFEADAVYVYRAQPVLFLHTSMFFRPDSLNLDLMNCDIPGVGNVTCFTVSVCIQAVGKSLPKIISLSMDLQLDSQKSRFLRRFIFLGSLQPNTTITAGIPLNSHEYCIREQAYLKDTEFKDVLSPIAVSVNVSLQTDQSARILPAIIQGNPFLQEQIHIILGCGEDNVCVPDLQLSANWGEEPLIIGIDNFVQINFNATNLGERAYEAELHVSLPSGAHYIQILGKSKERILCSQRNAGDYEYVVCELGNPLKNGTQISGRLQLSISDLEDSDGNFSFPMQIKCRESQNSSSPIVWVHLNVSVEVSAELHGSAQPAEVVLPLHKWKLREESSKPEDRGKIVTHVYELYNVGPGMLNVNLVIQSPENYEGDLFLYPLRLQTDDIVQCTDISGLNYLQLDIMEATKPPVSFSKSDGHRLYKREDLNKYQDVGIAGSDNSTSAGDGSRYNQSTILNCANTHCLEIECSIQNIAKGQSATVKLDSVLWVTSFMKRPQKSFVLRSRGYFHVTGSPYRIQPVSFSAAETYAETVVQWVTPGGQKGIPAWWIILAVFGGLLILALFVFVMWKLGFFRRTRPPTDEGEELTAGK